MLTLFSILLLFPYFLFANIAVSVIDEYKPPISSTAQSYSEFKPSLLQTASSTFDRHSERPLVENGDVDRIGSSANIAAPPRKRIKHSSCSSPHDSVGITIADRTATARTVSTAAVFTPAATAVVAPSLCRAQVLPLSGRLIGTVWQPVQSQSTTAAVSTSDGITVDFCSATIVYSLSVLLQPV